MIQEYESKFAQMEHDLAVAHRQILLESDGRKQFEENLKRIFLKNLTSMNMEAFALFSGAENQMPREVVEDTQVGPEVEVVKRHTPPPALAAASMFARVGQENSAPVSKNAKNVPRKVSSQPTVSFTKSGIKAPGFKNTGSSVDIALRGSVDALPRTAAPPNPMRL
jgi:hypothetical protein